jgi:hypothetical protein
MHVYEVLFQEIDHTVKKAMHAHAGIQNKLLNKSHCSKCGAGRIRSFCSCSNFMRLPWDSDTACIRVLLICYLAVSIEFY